MMPTVNEQRIENVRRHAVRQLSTHVVEKLLDVPPGEGKPGWMAFSCVRADRTFDRAFDVVTRYGGGDRGKYGVTIITGDSGDFIWERSLFWMKGAIDSVEYFAEKVPCSQRVHEYSQDRFREVLLDEAKLLKEALDDRSLSHEDLSRLREQYDSVMYAADHEGETEHEAMEWIVDSGIFDGCDLPDFRAYRHDWLWCRESLKFLLSKIDLE